MSEKMCKIGVVRMTLFALKFFGFLVAILGIGANDHDVTITGLWIVNVTWYFLFFYTLFIEEK